MFNQMPIVTLVAEALLFIFPAYCANAVPVLAGGGTPMDFGKNFFDGKRIFGDHKTFRGFFFGLLVGILVGIAEFLIFDYPILFIILPSLGALAGDLLGSFAKRRIGISPGGLFPIVDQIDFVIGALLFSIPLSILTWELALVVILITPPIHLLTNYVAFKMRLKKHPW
ncbi:CDP-2,3-bis-(O-geranylgeranyl)-sn-glycerol synthase [Candidatus Bathyarchaeota archaeon]|nr:CDP-2,3-bis-(O-geranylgeranyl)-sn-glycerol synthase [Candidatus Bathyarchaeota archaeon]